MKLIIDIDKDDYEYMKNGYVPSTFKTFSVIKNGTPIPDNATNGDVLKAIFPNTVFAEDKYEYDGVPWVDIFSDDGMTIEMAFWNAPYQKGGK